MVVGGLLCHFGGLLCLEAALYISLIDFEKFRCHCLHAEALSDFLSSITAGVSAFGRFWSGGSSLTHCSGLGMVQLQLEGRTGFNQQKSLQLTYARRTMEQRRRLVSTYDIQPKHAIAWSMCGYNLR